MCPHCGTIHYQNPRIIAGCVPDHEGRILLCRRAIEPRLGYWTFPAGFMENRETVQQAAARESLEEAQAHVQIGSLLAIVHVLEAQPGPYVLPRHSCPGPNSALRRKAWRWGCSRKATSPGTDIAFPSIEFALRRYFSDRAAGREDHHFTTAERRPRM